jgi:hypothetical protein
MDRRGFLKFLGAGAASAAIPFGRVWSFPSNIVIPSLSLAEMRERYLRPAAEEVAAQYDHMFAIGDVVTVNSYGPYIVTRVAESVGQIDLRGPNGGRGVLSYQSLPPESIRIHARNFWNQARIDDVDRFERQAPPRFARIAP